MKENPHLSKIHFIGALFVSSAEQGKGIGAKLLTYIARKYPITTLAVYCKNERAVQFYLKNSFGIVKEQRNTDTGENEYIMQRQSQQKG